MSIVTDNVSSCAVAVGVLSPFTIQVNGMSTANSSAAFSTFFREYASTSSANASATPAPKMVHTEIVVDVFHSFDDESDVGYTSVTSSANASATASPSAERGERLSSSAAASGDANDQLVAIQTLISKALANSSARFDFNSVAFWVNTKSMGSALWSGPQVDSYAMVDNVLMGSGPRLLAFVADDDDGADIASVIVDDWRHYGTLPSHEMRYSSAYVSARTDGPLSIGIETDENGAYTYQTHLPSSSNFVNHRAVLGKGLTGEYAKLSFMNIGGKDFDVAALSVYAFERPRRIGSR